MRINCNYVENSIIFEDGKINSIEMENKKIFYRFVRDLYSISNSDVLEEFIFLDDNNKEISVFNKIKIFNNFFEFDFNSKKYNMEILKQLVSEINDEDKNEILNLQKKIYTKVNKQLNKYDIPLYISIDIDLEAILKELKITIKNYDDILNNLFLLIDLENILRLSNILIFINLKQYLSLEELEEFYKYAIYNNVKLILVDSQCYTSTSKYEKKLIVDNDLVEFVI